MNKMSKTIIDGWENKILTFDRFKNAIAPSIIQEEVNYIKLGKNYARTLVVVDYPGKVKGNWLSELYRFKGNLTISTHLEPAKSDKFIDSTSKSIDEYNRRLEGNNNAKNEQELEIKRDSSKEMLRKMMHGNNNLIYYVHTYLHIQAENPEELDRLEDSLQRKLSETGIKAIRPEHNMIKAFKACLPTIVNTLPEYTFRNMDSTAVSTMFPFDESEIFEATGIIKGINKTTGTPVIIDQYMLKNHNEFVIGTSGAGKSFYLSTDQLRHFKDGIKIIVIDPLRDFKNIIEENNGQYIVISNKTENIINPLETMDMGQLMVFFKLIKSDLNPLETALIEDALMRTYRNNPKRSIEWDEDFSKIPSDDFPILGDLYEVIQDMKEYRLRDFEAILKTYVDGSNSRMFNHTTNVNLNNDWIGFDLKDLEQESVVQAAAMYTILSFIMKEIVKNAHRKQRLYVDEEHVLAHTPRAMKFLYDIYKTCRHYKCGCTAATQQISDHLTAIEGHKNYGKAIIGNSQSKMILSLEEQDISDLEEYNVIKLSEEEKRILSSDTKGEGIFIAGKKRVHIQVEATPEELKLIDPEQYDEKFGER